MTKKVFEVKITGTEEETSHTTSGIEVGIEVQADKLDQETLDKIEGLTRKLADVLICAIRNKEIIA